LEGNDSVTLSTEVVQRTGKGSHRQFVHPGTGHIITVAVHTKKEVGSGLAHRILKEAGLK
jgi:predicted RNA binding protein YcfA (HicA-like mRNA interferase family)